MKPSNHGRVLLAAAVLSVPGLAAAHGGVTATAGLGAGLAHPLLGLDHLLAMAAVGLWAVQCGGRALWAVPASFLAAMIGGALLALAGVGLPLVEPGIAGSVLLLGLVVAAGRRVPLAAAAGLVALLALFHGHAHGTEMPASASALGYATGFVLATALLHAGGAGAALALRRVDLTGVVRLLGAGAAVAGAWMLAAA